MITFRRILQELRPESIELRLNHVTRFTPAFKNKKTDQIVEMEGGFHDTYELNNALGNDYDYLDDWISNWEDGFVDEHGQWCSRDEVADAMKDVKNTHSNLEWEEERDKLVYGLSETFSKFQKDIQKMASIVNSVLNDSNYNSKGFGLEYKQNRKVINGFIETQITPYGYNNHVKDAAIKLIQNILKDIEKIGHMPERFVDDRTKYYDVLTSPKWATYHQEFEDIFKSNLDTMDKDAHHDMVITDGLEDLVSAISFPEIIKHIKNALMEYHGCETWKEFVLSQQIGDCQFIVSCMDLPAIKELKADIKTHFGEIRIDKPYRDSAGHIQHLATHHWVTVNGKICEFSKGTLRRYIQYERLLSADPEDETRYKAL